MSLKLVKAAAETANLFPNGNEFFFYEIRYTTYCNMLSTFIISACPIYK